MDPSSGRGAGVIQNLSCNIRASRGGTGSRKKIKKILVFVDFRCYTYPLTLINAGVMFFPVVRTVSHAIVSYHYHPFAAIHPVNLNEIAKNLLLY